MKQHWHPNLTKRNIVCQASNVRISQHLETQILQGCFPTCWLPTEQQCLCPHWVQFNWLIWATTQVIQCNESKNFFEELAIALDSYNGRNKFRAMCTQFCLHRNAFLTSKVIAYASNFVPQIHDTLRHLLVNKIICVSTEFHRKGQISN